MQTFSNWKSDTKDRWLPKDLIIQLLSNPDKYSLPLTTDPLKNQNITPNGGDVYLYQKSLTNNWRNDNINWAKKKNNKNKFYSNVNENHEKIKVNGKPVYNCSYAHCEDNPFFHRRSYWLLNDETDSPHILEKTVESEKPNIKKDKLILVHYRDNVISSRWRGGGVINTNFSTKKSKKRKTNNKIVQYSDDLSGLFRTLSISVSHILLFCEILKLNDQDVSNISYNLDISELEYIQIPELESAETNTSLCTDIDTYSEYNDYINPNIYTECIQGFQNAFTKIKEVLEA